MRWTITITNTGSTRLESLYFDYMWLAANGTVAAVTAFTGTSTPVTFNVVDVPTMTATWVGTAPALAPGDVLTIAIDATGPDNSGGTMSVIIKYPNAAGTQIGSTSSTIVNS